VDFPGFVALGQFTDVNALPFNFVPDNGPFFPKANTKAIVASLPQRLQFPLHPRLAHKWRNIAARPPS
jgi:hypothetical protein